MARSVTTWTAYGAMCSPWCSISVSSVWTTSSFPTVCISSKSASVSWGSTDTISSSQHSCSTIAFTASAACTRTGSSRSRTRPMIERTAAWNESAAADLPPAKRSWANWPYTQQHRARRKPRGDASRKTCACSIGSRRLVLVAFVQDVVEGAQREERAVLLLLGVAVGGGLRRRPQHARAVGDKGAEVHLGADVISRRSTLEAAVRGEQVLDHVEFLADELVRVERQSSSSRAPGRAAGR